MTKTKSISDFKNIPKDKEQFSISFIKENYVLILEGNKSAATIAYSEKTPEITLYTIKKIYRNINLIKTNSLEISSWLTKTIGRKNNTTAKDTNEKINLDKLANEDTTINLVNSILLEGIKQNASDIHLESERENFIVRYRINGELVIWETIDRERFNAVSSRIKLMAELNILEKRLPQDGRITVFIENVEIDLRVSIIPIKNGESIVLRILGRKNKIKNLVELGYSESEAKIIKQIIKIPHGLFLVTGPTGSGKTTTLYSIMQDLISPERKIISIEDPIEYSIKGVCQVQINEILGLGFNVLLKRILRQDPDIIMIGEIRDKETASLAIKAALTGHLVLSTLHTNSSVGVIKRLSEMGVERYLIASVLKGAIAQRLIKNKNTRCLVSEIFKSDAIVEALISENKGEAEIEKYLCTRKINRMNTLKQCAEEKIKNGEITKVEAEKEICFE